MRHLVLTPSSRSARKEIVRQGLAQLKTDASSSPLVDFGNDERHAMSLERSSQTYCAKVRQGTHKVQRCHTSHHYRYRSFFS